MTAELIAGEVLNVAARLTCAAAETPDAVAVAFPTTYDRRGRRNYDQVTFRRLDEDSTRLSLGFTRMGLTPGTRLALLVPPSIDFVTLVFALLKCGAVAILIDPGMGRKNLIRCLEAAQPEGFVAGLLVHFIRSMLVGRFKKAHIHISVGRSFPGCVSLARLRNEGAADDVSLPAIRADDPAAIIFTTGSTGPPKGVLFTHRNFDTQVTEIRDRYGIQAGEVDLPGFPLFGLFNAAMGVTTVIPDMNPSRPARVDPRKIIEAARDWNVTQAFGSPAIWNRVGRYCADHGERLPSLRRVLSAGAPVPADVLVRMKNCIHPEGEVFTPYGATEALPIASISASEVLGKTAAATDCGQGVCVGTRFSSIDWKIIRIVDGPIATIDEAEPLAAGEIGELIVRGPQVTPEYVTRLEWNARAKIRDGETRWHRMGDAGYFDEQDRFWFCGRVAQRVLTKSGPMFTVPCEAIFNSHDDVFRTALVGVGPPGEQMPVMVVEPQSDRRPKSRSERDRLIGELRRMGQEHELTAGIDRFLLHPSLPVDIRHNAKIFREKLAVWAERQLL